MRFLDIALRNAARGFRVFPVISGTKQPCIKDFPDLATEDLVTIEQWATKFPDANCGVMGDNFHLILDTDRWDKLQELFGPQLAIDPTLFDTYCISARENRRQFAFLQTDKSRAMQKRNLDYAIPGEPDNVLELKSWRKFGMGEGSIHKTGSTYVIVQDLPLKPVPDLLIDRTEELQPRAVTRERVPRNKIAEGGRRNALVREAGRVLRVTEMSKPVLVAHLNEFNEQWLEPPLAYEEVENVALRCNWEPERPELEVIIGRPKENGGADWRSHYHSFEEMEHAPPASFLIEGFLQRDAITALAAPVAQRKSLISLNVAHALCTKDPLFGFFAVTEPPARVLYLCPEMGLRSFTERVRKIGLMPYIGKTLFCRTMSADGTLDLAELTDEELAGAVVIIDTAVRYLRGDENSSEHMRQFAESIFRLMRDGAAAVLLLHHSAKGTKESSELSLENAMRGSGELGAFVSSCWATRLQDPSEPYKSASFLTNVKQRDFESLPFEVTSGPDCRLRIVGTPGDARLKSKGQGAPSNSDGNEERALQIIRDHPELSIRALTLKLKEVGIRRSKSWVGEKRHELHNVGIKTEIS